MYSSKHFFPLVFQAWRSQATNEMKDKFLGIAKKFLRKSLVNLQRQNFQV